MLQLSQEQRRRRKGSSHVLAAESALSWPARSGSSVSFKPLGSVHRCFTWVLLLACVACVGVKHCAHSSGHIGTSGFVTFEDHSRRYGLILTWEECSKLTKWHSTLRFTASCLYTNGGPQATGTALIFLLLSFIHVFFPYLSPICIYQTMHLTSVNTCWICSIIHTSATVPY